MLSFSRRKLWAALLALIITAVAISGCGAEPPGDNTASNDISSNHAEDGAVTDDAITDDSVAEDAVIGDIATDDNIIDDTVTDDAIDLSAGDIVTAYVFDVGEGQSILIDDKETEVLIDAGHDSDGEGLCSKISEHVADNTIEYVIATHSHDDHIGGMEDIYEAFAVEHTIYGDIGNTLQFNEFFAAANSKCPDVREDENEVIALPEGVTLSIIDVLDGESEANDNSVISVLDVDGKKMLVTGDYEDMASKWRREALIGRLQESGLYPVDIYVVGHHGSETSSSGELLELINPAYALISSEGPTGQYKNPDPKVLERLTGVGAEIYETYLNGNIKVTFENGVINITSDRLS
jgi:beta-lactamase superfamily II metal-dependent hydrolase